MHTHLVFMPWTTSSTQSYSSFTRRHRHLRRRCLRSLICLVNWTIMPEFEQWNPVSNLQDKGLENRLDKVFLTNLAIWICPFQTSPTHILPLKGVLFSMEIAWPIQELAYRAFDSLKKRAWRKQANEDRTSGADGWSCAIRWSSVSTGCIQPTMVN